MPLADEKVRVPPQDLRDVVEAGHRPEAPVRGGLDLPVDRIVFPERSERPVGDLVHEEVVVREVDLVQPDRHLPLLHRYQKDGK